MKFIPKLMMSLQGIKYGKNCSFHGIPIIAKSKSASIKLGNGCRIRSGVLTNLIGLYQRTIITAKSNGAIEIGDDVGMSGVTIYARDSIKIGAKCLIGANTKIFDNDFHPIDAEIRRETPGKHIPSKPVVIGENVFIGCNALILKGTVLGNNCVVGAGAVVSGRFEDNCIIAGNPAKVIKKLEDA